MEIGQLGNQVGAENLLISAPTSCLLSLSWLPFSCIYLGNWWVDWFYLGSWSLMVSGDKAESSMVICQTAQGHKTGPWCHCGPTTPTNESVLLWREIWFPGGPQALKMTPSTLGETAWRSRKQGHCPILIRGSSTFLPLGFQGEQRQH